MRKVICLFVLLLFLAPLFCQDPNLKLGDLNAEWVNNYAGFGNGIAKVKYESDTVVGNKNIRVFSKTAFRLIDNEIKAFERAPVYIYEVDAIVEFSEDLIHFDTLYNFQADIGESWTIPKRHSSTGEMTGEFLEREVVDTFTHDINGVGRYCLGIATLNEMITDTVCQGVGSRLTYILPFDFQSVGVDGGEGGVLRCFKDDLVGVFDFKASLEVFTGLPIFFGFEYDCDQLSSIDITAASFSDFRVYPNPASDYIRVSTDNMLIENLSIYTISGHLILQDEYSVSSVDLDISALSPGMYFMLINGMYFEKLVLTHE